MKARIKIYAVELECPKCEESIEAPNGSFFWSVEEIDALKPPNTVQCRHCERQLAIKRSRSF